MSSIRVASLVVMLTAAEARADVVTLSEKPDHVTEGVAIIDASPHDVYALVTDYSHWPEMFGDISRVGVQSGDRRDARVRFHSRSIGYTVTVQFDNVPDLLIRFTGIEGPPGGRSHGEYRLEPIDGGKRTRVIADVYMDITGVAGWVITDSRIRGKRRAKVAADLGDIARHFAHVAPGA
jgi:polyketide cyclase/dehydrase/lipid transport protein